MPNYKPVEQRFYEKTYHPEGSSCLIWTAKSREFVVSKGQRSISRRQAAWLIIRKEPLPPFRSLLATCGNELCVNPDHFQPASGPAYRPLEDRFWEKVNKDGPVPPQCPELGKCWSWTGSTYEGGYGSIGVGPQNKGAHRIAWELAHGTIPDGIEVCHTCDNPNCVRESHLFLGTHKENMGDCVAKNRFANPIGTLNPRAILSEDDVRYIRDVCAIPGGHRPTYKELAGAFNLKSPTTIADIHLRKLWKHV